jgi:biopolymer transport protein ExbD
LKILRFPPISGPREALTDDAETLTAVLNFIPMANQKIKALRDKMANGGTLTANEQAYLTRIKEVPCLIKLALVKPSAPVPTLIVTSAPPMPAPVAVAAPPAIPPAPPVSAGPAPIRAVVRVDGKINFQGATYELPGFKSKLEALMKATPDQAIVIRAGKKVSYEKFKAALDICQSAEVKNLSIASPAPQPPPATPAATESSTTNLPAPGLLMHPSMEPMSATPPEAPSAPPTTNAPAPAGP